MKHGTLFSGIVAMVVATARQLGIEVDDLLAPLGLSDETLADPDARIDFDVAIGLADALAERSGEPDFGLRCAKDLSPDALDLHEYLIRCSETLGAGLRRMSRYLRLLSTPGRFEVELAGDEMHLVSRPPRLLSHHWHEFVLSIYLNLARVAAGTDLIPTRVSFTNAEPRNRRMLEETFGSELGFACPDNAIVFPRALDALKLPSHDERAVRIFERYALIKLAGVIDDPTVMARVSTGIFQLLPRGELSLENVARVVGMSERSVQRGLRDEGSSFRELLDAVRHELAVEHLKARTLPIAAIAILLGFSEVSAFHRSFRRWTGQTPAAFRAAAGKPPP